jgi:hypothetical protein
MAGISKFSITKLKEKEVLSEETALKIVIDLCKTFDIDVDAETDKKQKKRIESLLEAMVEFVRRGLLEFKEGKIIQHLKNAKGEVVEINYKIITGRQKMAMDGKDENDRFEMMYAVLASAAGLPETAIQKLYGIDLKVAESLTIFFL